MPPSGEWTLLEKINRRIQSDGITGGQKLIRGIGDDCAVIETAPGHYAFITTDISIESVHFRREAASPEDIGYRAMMSNISDICAMGGQSEYAFIALGIPPALDDDYIDRLYQGFLEAASEGSLTIAGGDISKARDLTISIALHGRSLPGHDPVYRSGARQGDTLYCTGTLGGSRAGLELLLSGNYSKKNHGGKLKPSFTEHAPVRRHLRPPCRQSAVEELMAIYQPTAMIDISDGLISDLGHICSAGEVGAEIDFAALPVHEGVKEYALQTGRDLRELILESGEEYELLFTSPAKKGKENINGVPVTPVGTITGSDINLKIEGKTEKIIPRGFDHFSK